MKQNLKIIPNISGGGRVMIKKKLTTKQQTFVQEYLVDHCATQAAIRAGYSKKAAHDIGCENLKKPNIAAAISKAQAKRSEATKIKADDVLRDLREVADVCLGRRSTLTTKEVVDQDGLPHKVEEEVTRFSASGAIRALESIGKHLGMFNNDGDIEDQNAIFIANVRALITPEPTLPRDRVDDRLGGRNEDHI